LSEKTQKRLIQETHQGMFGVPGTDDKGLVGDVKGIKMDIREQNGRVRKNSKLIYIIMGVLITAGALGGLEIGDILHLLGE